MALQGPIPVTFDMVFPHGCYVVGEVEKVKDFDASTNGRFVQARDKQTSELVWQVAVMDADPTLKPAQKTVAVKILAPEEESPERPTLTMEQVFVLAGAIDPRFRALVLVATFGSLRWGELAALRRKHVDLEVRTVRVVASTTELKDGSVTVGPPKSAAGLRTVTLPVVVNSELRAHLDAYTGSDDEAFVFVGAKGAVLRRPTFSRTWAKALKAAELSGFHFHDLRHTGNKFASQSGATLRELMNRMGHSTTRAALIYLHAEGERDRMIADSMGKLVAEAFPSEDHGASGT
ncbi:site-specific integrase [Sphaerisporangium sp. NPDC005289]|uniref:tyrosine-type recombinase/integrase n=1 Tax=Sphaerisporangium sp. NPDC005289 TaxID=3155247 RepID=UPI0033A73DC8